MSQPVKLSKAKERAVQDWFKGHSDRRRVSAAFLDNAKLDEPADLRRLVRELHGISVEEWGLAGGTV